MIARVDVNEQATLQQLRGYLNELKAILAGHALNGGKDRYDLSVPLDTVSTVQLQLSIFNLTY